MLKTSTVTNVSAAGTWESPYGIMFRFEIKMENGDVGQALTKKEQQDTYIIGDTIEYEFTDGKFPKIKRAFDKPTSFTPKVNINQDIIVRQVAFKGAVEFVCSNGGGLDDILNYTDIFNTFILTKEKPETSDKLPF